MPHMLRSHPRTEDLLHPQYFLKRDKKRKIARQPCGINIDRSCRYMDLEGAKRYILERLDRELPGDLSYHSPQHTRDVVAAAMRIGASEGLSAAEMALLETAAYYHDSGFIYTYANHEERGCQVAREVLPGFGYIAEQIELVCETIMATKIPQSPKSHMAQVLCDADLDYLGSDQFYPVGGTLLLEFLGRGIIADEQAWNRMQIRFLESHSYFTETAIRERNPMKLNHLAQVREIVAGYDA